MQTGSRERQFLLTLQKQPASNSHHASCLSPLLSGPPGYHLLNVGNGKHEYESCSATPPVLTLLLQGTLRTASTALLLRMLLRHLLPPQQLVREPEDCSPMSLIFFEREREK